MPSLLRQSLALIAVVSVSGIHLAFMQAGAWAWMWWDRDRDHLAQNPDAWIQTIEGYFTGAHPCERCLATLRAGLDAQRTDDEKPRPAGDSHELRLIPVQARPAIRIAAPPAGLQDRPPLRIAASGQADPTPVCPPPERLLAGLLA
ncbi:MAG: hypothetical protein JNK37_18845 [Verrucomicrobiales bacterium]|nr:hypothetical protein [Verrucomicrobiales bacterium]